MIDQIEYRFLPGTLVTYKLLNNPTRQTPVFIILGYCDDPTEDDRRLAIMLSPLCGVCTEFIHVMKTFYYEVCQ